MSAAVERVISVVIPTHNRCRALSTVLPSYDDSLIDSIVVVDDGSFDDTVQVVKRFAARARVKVQLLSHTRRLGVQAARMTGVRSVSTDWVLFGEDDVLLGSGCCSRLYEEAMQLGADAIAGRLIPTRCTEPDIGRDSDPVSPSLEVFNPLCFEGRFDLRCASPVRAPYLHAVALIRRSLLTQIGFDARYKGNAFREETDFYLGAAAAGASLLFTPNCLCWHLRGPLARTGGHRASGVSYLRAEFYGFVNTYKLVRKHWSYLVQHHNFSGCPGIYLATQYLTYRIRYALMKAKGGSQLFLRDIS